MNTTQRVDPAREAIIERIRKLAKMTTANGCSENEAAFAAKKLEELTREYNVTQDETALRLDADGQIEDIFVVPVGNEGTNWTRYVGIYWELYTVKHYFSFSDEDALDLGFKIPCVTIHFFGYPVDVAAALATTQIVQLAMKDSVRKYKKNISAKEKTAFQDGFATRIRERLQEIINMRKYAQLNVPSGTGTGLVVLKNQLVTEDFAKKLREKGIRLGGMSHSNVTGAAQGAGRAAANSVDLSGGAKLGGGARRIGNG